MFNPKLKVWRSNVDRLNIAREALGLFTWQRRALQKHCLAHGHGKKTRGAYVRRWAEVYEYVATQVLADDPEADLKSDGPALENKFLEAVADDEYKATPEDYRKYFDSVMKEED